MSEEKAKEKKEEKGEKTEIPEKFKKLIKEIESLSVMDLAKLVKILEERFGVSAVQPMVAAVPTQGPSAGEAGTQEEKTSFSVLLKEIGDKKIEVIKAIRDITGRGLKESKDLVDAVASGPQIVKENIKKEEAEEIKKRLETAGAKVELK